jgi:hypothetical protein
MHARAWKVSLDAASLWLASLCFVACAGEEPSLLGKQCSASGACLRGYVCSPYHVCIPSEVAHDARDDAAVASGVARAIDARAIDAGAPGIATADAATADAAVARIPAAVVSAADGGGAHADDDAEVQAPQPTRAAPLPDCAGADRCAGACVDLAHDPQHCGACDRVCSASAHSVASCEAGQCQSRCQDGWTSCTGECVDLSSDHAHCGACGTACSAAESCAQGVCVSACPSGTLACGGGCVDTSSDPSNCGSCARVCPTAKLADATCDQGSCGTRCQDGSDDCNGKCTNGAVVQLAHLAGLGTLAPCAAQLALDALASLVSVCDAGLHPCAGSCVNLSSDADYCGDCDTACSSDQTCNAGSCVQP